MASVMEASLLPKQIELIYSVLLHDVMVKCQQIFLQKTKQHWNPFFA